MRRQLVALMLIGPFAWLLGCQPDASGGGGGSGPALNDIASVSDPIDPTDPALTDPTDPALTDPTDPPAVVTAADPPPGDGFVGVGGDGGGPNDGGGIEPVPEPSGALIGALGTLLVAGVIRRRRRQGP